MWVIFVIFSTRPKTLPFTIANRFRFGLLHSNAFTIPPRSLTFQRVAMNECMVSPRSSGKFIADNAANVSIKENGIDKCVSEILERINDGRLSLDLILYKENGVHPTSIEEKDIEWVFMTSALNFSFWTKDTEPQYLVTYKGKTQNGYMSMCAAINRTLDSGIPLTDPDFYGKISEEDLEKYLMGDDNVSCPMIKERVSCLHEIGSILKEKYGGKFSNCLLSCEKSASKLLQMVTKDFPCFYDGAHYKGSKVTLHKRAQILVADLWQLFEAKGLCEFDDIDSITMFADYRVPQSLQYFGAFEYSAKLKEFLKSDQLLKNGDERETEIRGCSIEAVGKITRKVNDRLGARKVNDIQIDNFLWCFRREKADEMIKFPYHKVRSIYY